MFRLLLVALLSLTASLVSASETPTLEQRLDKLTDRLEAARQDMHIPGMSIAIVKDDKVIMSRGFGLANVAAKKPADETTIYAIGSTTKAFTATLVGMLVDDGKANWDDPVTHYLPYFDLQVRSEDANAEATLRDLLSHRSGFSRMGLLWFGGQVSRQDVLRTAAGAEPWDDFRKSFNYCNVTYLAAGEAAGVAAGSTWDALMQQRILEPLKMTASTLSISAAQKGPHLALGYRWDNVDEQFVNEKMIDLDSVGPAGSVNSNVVDMAQWLRLQLGRGEVDGTRLISTERIQDTWSPQIEISDDVSYGLGWMLREHNGREVVEHGGNINGFSAQVGLIPEEDLGYVLLMNINASPLQQASLAMVFDALLENWPEETVNASVPTNTEEINFEDYTGVYVANFATFRDEEFEILISGDHLALNIPSQQTFGLEQPDSAGKWRFTLTDQIAVSFARDDQGAVIGVTIHQGGYDFEVPRKGLAIEPEAPIEELEKYVGIYVRDEGGKRIKIFVARGRLTIEDKGNHLAFDVPDAEGHASLRARQDQGATFKTDAEGNVESLVFHGSSGDKLFTRLLDVADTKLPTLDEVLALRQTSARIAAMQAASGTKVSGEVWVPQAGIRGKLTLYTQGHDRYANHMDFGKFGRVDGVARGSEAWSYNSMRGFNVLQGDELEYAILEHPGAVEGDWNDYFDSIAVVRNDIVNDRPVYVVRLKKGAVQSRTYWVDAERGDVLRVKLIVTEASMRIPVTITYADFAETDGIRHARRVEIENPASGKMVMTLEKFESGLELGDDIFTLEDPDDVPLDSTLGAASILK